MDVTPNQCQVFKGQICIEPICMAVCAHPCVNVCIMHDSQSGRLKDPHGRKSTPGRCLSSPWAEQREAGFLPRLRAPALLNFTSQA